MPKHYTGEVKTIRGTLKDVGSLTVTDLIFNYESPDRTRGWIVEGAWTWVADPFVTVSSDSNGMILANLATDAMPNLNKEDIINPDDNRSIGWNTKQYIVKNGAGGAKDFVVPNAIGIADMAFLLDLDRIITNDLHINAVYFDSASETQSVKLGYMIVLREVSLSPSQSLLQQLKGIGQNVDN